MFERRAYDAPFLIAAICAAFTAAYQLMGGPHADLLASEFVNPDIHVPVAGLYTAFLGLMAVAATPNAGLPRILVEKIGPWAAGAFAAVFGSILGWGLTVSALYPFAVGFSGLVSALQTATLTLFVAIGGWYGYAAIVPVFNENTGLMLRARRGEFARVALGSALIVYGLSFFMMWFLFD